MKTYLVLGNRAITREMAGLVAVVAGLSAKSVRCLLAGEV